MKPLVNVADLTLAPQQHGEDYLVQMGQIGPLLGARLMGCRYNLLPPGKKAWPYHSHHANEELFVILSGDGTLRFGGETHPVKPGDVIVCPPGGAETAHQLHNSGTDDLRYLAISTMNVPDVMEYPDSGKFGVMAGAGPGGGKTKRRLHFYGRQDSGVDYWDGE